MAHKGRFTDQTRVLIKATLLTHLLGLGLDEREREKGGLGFTQKRGDFTVKWTQRMRGEFIILSQKGALRNDELRRNGGGLLLFGETFSLEIDMFLHSEGQV